MKKLLVCLLLVALCLGLCIWIVPRLIEKEMEKRLDLVNVAVAAKDLKPRTVITKEDIRVISLPSAYLNDSAYLSPEEIIGKVTVKEGWIPEGSLFYFNSLEMLEEISDRAILGLNENQVLVAFETNLIQMGANALCEGQLVDIYLTIETKERTTLVRPLLKNVRILGVKDHKGMEIENSSEIPHVVQFAIDEEVLSVLQLAKQMGSLSYYATGSSYTKQKECAAVWDEEISELLGIKKAIE